MTDQELAKEYAVGTLDAAARSRVAVRMIEDRVFRSMVEEWELRLAPLALAGDGVAHPDLFASIETRIAAAGVALPGTITRRAGAGEWVTVSPGLEIKVMHRIPALNRMTFLARLAPGAEYLDHDHDQDEEIYMIEGDLTIGGITLRAGDFHIAKAGFHHPVHRTTGGCVCLISQAASPI